MTFSPETPVAERIRAKFQELSTAQIQVAEYILAHPEEAAILSSAKVAKKAGVSQSTVVRLTYFLGYESFKDLQMALQAQVALRLNSLAKMQFSMNQAEEEIPVTYKAMQGDVESIVRTMQMLSPELLDEVIDGILDARRVYVLGSGVSSVGATFLGLGLRRILHETIVLTNDDGDAAERLIGIQSRDMLIAFSYARYSRHTTRCTELVRKLGGRIIAVTDSPVSPIARVADTIVVTTPLSAWYLGAPVAQVSVSGAILAGLVTRRRSRAQDRLTYTESMLDFFNYYEQPSDDPKGSVPAK